MTNGNAPVVENGLSEEVMDLLKKAAALGILTESGNIQKEIRAQVKVVTVPTKRIRVAKSKVAAIELFCANGECRASLGVHMEKATPAGSHLECGQCGETSKVGKRAFVDEFRVGFGGDWTEK